MKVIFTDIDGVRGHEIDLWLEKHMPFFVQTTWKDGLTEELTDKVIKILNS